MPQRNVRSRAGVVCVCSKTTIGSPRLRMNELRQMTSMACLLLVGGVTWGLAAGSVHAEADHWVHLGPYDPPGSGFTPWVVTLPAHPGVLIAGTRPHGLWRSTDDGATWQRVLTDAKFSENVGPNPRSFAAAPSDPRIIYAGFENRGAYRSDDAGVTWRHIASDLPRGRCRNGVSAAVDARNSAVVYLGTDGGLFRSVDGGAHWSRLNRGLTGDPRGDDANFSQTISGISIDPRRPDTLLVSLYATEQGQPAGVWRSDDAGATWCDSSNGLPRGVEHAEQGFEVRTDWVWDLQRSRSNPDVLYAALTRGVARSDDGGITWRLPEPAPPFRPFTLAVDPADPDTLYAGENSGDGRVFRSTDGGVTWVNCSDGLRLGPEPDAKEVSIVLHLPDGSRKTLTGLDRKSRNSVDSLHFDLHHPNRLYAATSAGVYRLDLALKRR